MDYYKCLTECYPGSRCGIRSIFARRIEQFDEMECPCCTCLIKMMCKEQCTLYNQFAACLYSWYTDKFSDWISKDSFLKDIYYELHPNGQKNGSSII